MVSSLMHKLAYFDLDNLNSEKWFNDVQVYNCSKLANILVANELSRKLNGTGILQHKLPMTLSYLMTLLLFTSSLCKKLTPPQKKVSILTCSDNSILQFGLLNYWTLCIMQYCNETTFLKLYICCEVKRWRGTYTPSYIHYKKLVSFTGHCNLAS